MNIEETKTQVVVYRLQDDSKHGSAEAIEKLENALKLSMIWLDDETPKYIVDELLLQLKPKSDV